MTPRPTIRVWITKYALTQGILQADDAEVCVDINPGMIRVPSMGTSAMFHGEGRQWHRTEASALKRAEQMRRDRIKSLERQIGKLKGMTFEARAEAGSATQETETR